MVKRITKDTLEIARRMLKAWAEHCDIEERENVDYKIDEIANVLGVNAKRLHKRL